MVKNINVKDGIIKNIFELWNEYDEMGNLIHHKDSSGFEEWKEYDVRGNKVYHKDSSGFKHWRKYDENGKMVIKFIIEILMVMRNGGIMIKMVT